MGDENHIRTLGDYSRASHEGYRNTIELPDGNNVVLLRSDTIRLVQNGCSFHGLRSEDPNQHLKDFLRLVNSLDLDVANKERTCLHLFQFSLRAQARNWLKFLLARSISTWEDLTTRFLDVDRDDKVDNRTNNEPVRCAVKDLTEYKVRELVETPRFNDSLLAMQSGKMECESYHSLPVEPMRKAMLKKMITKKEDMGGNFVIPSDVGGLKYMDALVEQGSDVNIMPLFTCNRLTDEKLIETDIRLSLASQSYIYPLGIAEDVLVEIACFIYPVDFIILDIKEDRKRPFILGTPFLTTAKAKISHFLDILENYNLMDDEPMWAADRVVSLTPGSVITIPETANEFAVKCCSNSDIDKVMARMDAMTMKMDAQYKEMQSRSNHSITEYDEDDKPMSPEAEAKFMQTFRRMPNYGKFLKELTSNKQKLEQISSAFQSDENFAMIQNKVPPKLEDPESFIIPCTFSKAFSCNALADLGASINLMPYSLYAKLSLETLKLTKISVRLANRSFQHPIGIAKNMLIEVGKFTFPVDFAILEMEEGKDFDALLDERSEILPSIEGSIIKEKLFAEFDEFMAINIKENSESESETEETPFEKITFNTDYKIKTSLKEPPSDLELKPLPGHLEYVFLEEPTFIPVILNNDVKQLINDEDKEDGEYVDEEEDDEVDDHAELEEDDENDGYDEDEDGE
ncbi:reverse transcriptase domain-containing protein [Tanacetum coccineum]